MTRAVTHSQVEVYVVSPLDDVVVPRVGGGGSQTPYQEYLTLVWGVIATEY